MLKRAQGRVERSVYTVIIAMLGFMGLCFTGTMSEQQWLAWSNNCLAQSFNPDGEVKLKKWDLSVTNDAFLRLRKTYINGKQEYFSFHLHRFNDIDYLGTTIAGVLRLTTVADDIIVQTYDDPKGNIDSMATTMDIQVKNMPPERLDSLRDALLAFKPKK